MHHLFCVLILFFVILMICMFTFIPTNTKKCVIQKSYYPTQAAPQPQQATELKQTKPVDDLKQKVKTLMKSNSLTERSNLYLLRKRDTELKKFASQKAKQIQSKNHHIPNIPYFYRPHRQIENPNTIYNPENQFHIRNVQLQRINGIVNQS